MPTGVAPPLPRRLLRTPAPQPGESFPGYLLRLTDENSYDSLRWIPERAGLMVDPARGRSRSARYIGSYWSILAPTVSVLSVGRERVSASADAAMTGGVSTCH